MADKKHKKKSEAVMANEERNRNIKIGLELILANSKDAVIFCTGWDGAFSYQASSRTYALGAADRISTIERRREELEEERRNQDGL